MANPHNYPNGKKAALQWKINIHEKVEAHGLACNISAEELQEIKADMAALIYFDRDCLPLMEKYIKAINFCRQEAAKGSGSTPIVIPPFPEIPPPPPPRPPGGLNRTNNLLSRMKLSPAYTEAMGLDLGIIPTTSTKVEPSTVEIELALGQGKNNKTVLIYFKKGKHDGVYVEFRNHDREWEFCGIDNSKPHIHDRPLLVANVPEIREYRARFWDKGVANGLWSPTKVITVTP